MSTNAAASETAPPPPAAANHPQRPSRAATKNRSVRAAGLHGEHDKGGAEEVCGGQHRVCEPRGSGGGDGGGALVVGGRPAAATHAAGAQPRRCRVKKRGAKGKRGANHARGDGRRRRGRRCSRGCRTGGRAAAAAASAARHRSRRRDAACGGQKHVGVRVGPSKFRKQAPLVALHRRLQVTREHGELVAAHAAAVVGEQLGARNVL